MAFSTSALVTFALPTTYADGVTPWPASNYGGAVVFRDGSKVGNVTAPSLTFTDVNIPVGTHEYTVEVTDSVDGLTSSASAQFQYIQAAPPQAPAAPVITSIVAA